MDAAEIRTQAARPSIRLRLGPLLAMMGMAMVITAFIIRIVIATVAADYFALEKTARDSAVAGSDVLQDLAVISTWPVWTLPFLFLGLATMMVGIALLFSTIPHRIQQRAGAMALTLPKIISEKAR